MEKRIESLERNLSILTKEIHEIKELLGTGFTKIAYNFDSIKKEIDALNKRVDTLHKKVDVLNLTVVG
jgi:chaperonin cofactor prefoldin